MAKEEKGEDHEELKKAYDEAKKKYNLIPTFDELDKEFEITIMDPDRTHFIIKDIKRTISAKIHKFIDNIAPVISPQPSSLHSMVECKWFEKEDVEDMFHFYKKLMHLLHQAILAGMKTEKDEADFINYVWNEWPQIKNKMIVFMSEIVEGWARDEKVEKRDEYLG